MLNLFRKKKESDIRNELEIVPEDLRPNEETIKAINRELNKLRKELQQGIDESDKRHKKEIKMLQTSVVETEGLIKNVLNKIEKLYQGEKEQNTSILKLIAENLRKTNEKINGITKELELKDQELQEYKEGYKYRVNKSTFQQLDKILEYGESKEDDFITKTIKDVYELNGFIEIDADESSHFDPKRHKIVEVKETKEKDEDNLIKEVRQKGYFVEDLQGKERIIRPASVVISKTSQGGI